MTYLTYLTRTMRGPPWCAVLKREVSNFRLLPNSKSDKACAQVIADDGIHILINLNRSCTEFPHAYTRSCPYIRQ